MGAVQLAQVCVKKCNEFLENLEIFKSLG